jgi:hypothetical protein
MKPRIEIKPLVFVALATAAFSMGFQELKSAAVGAERVFVKNCSRAGCHAGSYPPQGLNLDKDHFQRFLIDVPSREVPDRKLVDTKNPEQSYLLMKIKGSEGIVGRRMPAYAPALGAEEISAVETWVQSLKGLELRQKKAPSRNEIKKPAFWGMRTINLPTPRSIGRSKGLFWVSHRFLPAVKEGYDTFYGLDGPASILLGLGYGISDNLSLMLSRANVLKEFELGLKWTLKDQNIAGRHLSMALLGSLSLRTQSVLDRRTFSKENLSFNIQASLAYAAHPSFSLLLVPGYSTNTDPEENSFQGTLYMGLGGKVRIIDDISILLEWVPVLSGFSLESSGWGLGIEKKIGGHVFQVFVLNSIGITTPQFSPGGDFRIGEGEFRIGFTIYRWF